MATIDDPSNHPTPWEVRVSYYGGKATPYIVDSRGIDFCLSPADLETIEATVKAVNEHSILAPELKRKSGWVSELRSILLEVRPVLEQFRDRQRARALRPGPRGKEQEQALAKRNADEMTRILERTRKVMKEIGDP